MCENKILLILWVNFVLFLNEKKIFMKKLMNTFGDLNAGMGNEHEIKSIF